MTNAPRVVWREGMHLSQHHFQAQSRHHEDAIHFALSQLFFKPYGLAGVELDGESLRNGVARLVHARGVLPDGLAFNVPEADAPPEPHDIREAFSPTQPSHQLLLAVPSFRRAGANLADGADALGAAGNGGGPARYAPVPLPVRDELTGRDERAVHVGRKQLRLLLDVELGDGMVAMPIARVRRDGMGHFVYDADFVPPCLQLGASPRLVALLHGVVEMLDGKGAALAATMRPAAGAEGASAYAGNEIATRWMLHAVRSAEAPLRHLLQTRRAHPERLWLELTRLAGALCTFSLTATPRDLPDYAHDDLAGCFAALERHVRAHLDVVVTPRVVVVPLARASEVLHVGSIADPRAFEPGARWFLSLRSALGPVETGARAPTLVKACASKFVLELVRRAFPGMALDHVPAPPPGLAPRADRAYFEIAVAGPCATGLRESREFGVYVPDTLPEAVAELLVLVPG